MQQYVFLENVNVIGTWCLFSEITVFPILSLLLLSNTSMRVGLYLCARTTALVIHVGVRLALTWLGHVTELSPLFL